MSNEKLFNNLREEIEGLKIKIWQLDGYPPYNSKHNKLPTDKKQQKEIINIIKKEKASLERILGTVSWMKEDGLLKKPLTKSKKGGRKRRNRKTKKRTLRKKNRKGGVYSILAKKAIKNNALKYPKIHMARYEKIDPKDLITKKTIKNVYPNKHPGRYGGGKKTMNKKRRKRKRKHRKKRTRKKSRMIR